MSKSFSTWLDTFVSEKGLDTEHVFTVDTDDFWGQHIIPLAVVLEHLKMASPTDQAQAKNIIVKIDFMNGDVMHFFTHLAKGVAASVSA